jgi:hypothetical protein
MGCSFARRPDIRFVLRVATLLIGEEFDGPVKKVTARASDHGAFKRPVGGVHDVPARHCSGKPASYVAVFVHVRRTVKECNVSLHQCTPFPRLWLDGTL